MIQIPLLGCDIPSPMFTMMLKICMMTPTIHWVFLNCCCAHNVLGKVKDFLGVMSEANKQLELDVKDHPEKYDIEELTRNESKVIEMDLMIGVADLHTPDAVAAAESAISNCPPVLPLAANESGSDSDENSADDDNGDDEIESTGNECDDGNNSDKPVSLVQKSMSGKDNINEKQKGNRCSQKRPKIVELS